MALTSTARKAADPFGELTLEQRLTKAKNEARTRQPHGWTDHALTDEQRHARGLMEARMRAGRLRGLPSCFGALA